MSAAPAEVRPRPVPRPDVRALAAGRPWGWWLAVAVLVGGAFGLRVWGSAHGLPYVYNTDENAHFVPKAIAFFGHSLDPDYFVNPPAYTYLLYVVYGLWFGGREAVAHAYATDPTSVFVVARVTSAALGALAVWFLYLAGARLFDRRAGLLAGGLLALGFLPVFYSHLALNDVPTLAPLSFALWGAARVLRRGGRLDYAMAGVGLGLACATKYTGGIVLLPILAAAAARHRDGAAPVLRRLLLAGLLAVAAFFAANPYAFLDWNAFIDGLRHQSDASSGAGAGKLGLTDPSGLHYYLWTLTWGLGWVPAVLALAGAVRLGVRHRWSALLLVPAPLAYYLFMGTQDRYFGRWLLPVFPMLCLLAAAGTLWLVGLAARRAPAWRPALLGIGAVALLIQGAIATVHIDRVLSRPDTRNEARAWLVAHVPPGGKIVVEPFMPDQWAEDIGRPLPGIPSGRRWHKFHTSRSSVDNHGNPLPHGATRIVNVEDYERTTRPALVHEYLTGGWCWLISGSTQAGRAFAQPRQVPQAIAYYRELRRRATVAAVFSPYASGARPVPFNFDWSFDFYPRAYAQPGPTVTIYRLHGGQCS